MSETYGVVMMISASTSSFSKTESGPSLSEVVTRVWPWSSSHLRMPSSFSVVPSRAGTWSSCLISKIAFYECLLAYHRLHELGVERSILVLEESHRSAAGATPRISVKETGDGLRAGARKRPRLFFFRW